MEAGTTTDRGNSYWLVLLGPALVDDRTKYLIEGCVNFTQVFTQPHTQLSCTRGYAGSDRAFVRLGG